MCAMHRSMMQVYVKDSREAVEFYRRAFGAEVICCHTHPDGWVEHAELNVHGQVLAVSEARDSETLTGNTMQFCLHFGEGCEPVVQKIFETLKDGATIDYPPGPCDWSPLLVGLIDKYGVNWCIFV